MVRSVIAVIVSYVIMVLIFFVGIVCIYAVVGTQWAFKPGSYRGSNRWLLATMVLDLVVAIIAGFICFVLAGGGKAPAAFAILTLVLGVAFAFPALSKEKVNSHLVRSGEVTQSEAMQKAYNPSWALFAYPLVGTIGILIGGNLKRRGQPGN